MQIIEREKNIHIDKNKYFLFEMLESLNNFFYIMKYVA